MDQAGPDGAGGDCGGGIAEFREGVSMRHRYLLKAAFLIWFAVAGCATSPVSTAPPEGPALRAALLGVWGNSDDEGRTFWGFDEFRADGTLASTGTFPVGTEPFRLAGTFDVSGRKVCSRVTEASGSATLPVGHSFCVEVLYIDSNIQRYRSDEDQEIHTLYRVSRRQSIATRDEPSAMPKRASGLWRTAGLSGVGYGWDMCVQTEKDHLIEDDLWMNFQKECRFLSQSREGEQYRFEAVCEDQTKLSAVIEGDFSSHYKATTISSSVVDAKTTTRRIVVHAQRVGECPADIPPGAKKLLSGARTKSVYDKR
jgi:hypothetical protein